METPDPNMSYNEAMRELEGILSSLRSDKCDVDTLVSLTRRAAALLTLCRSRLTRTEEELASVLEAINNEES